MNKTQQDLRLLPNKYKRLAYGLILFSICTLVLVLTEIIFIDKEIAKAIVKSGVLASLLILALCEDKIEDELTLKIRLKAFTFSFVFGVAYVIAMPFVNLLFDGKIVTDDMDMSGLLLTMFFVYFGIKTMMKKNR